MGTGNTPIVNYLRDCHARRFRITLVIGLVMLALVFAEVSAYWQNTLSFKMFDRTVNDRAEYPERPADLSTREGRR